MRAVQAQCGSAPAQSIVVKIRRRILLILEDPKSCALTMMPPCGGLRRPRPGLLRVSLDNCRGQQE